MLFRSTVSQSQTVASTTITAGAPAFYVGTENLGTGSARNLILETGGTARVTVDASTGNATFTGAVLHNSTGGVGYSTGAGGTVTQGTSRTTGVTLNKTCGQITLFSKTTTAGLIETFTVTNSTVAATDTVIVNHQSAGTAGQYIIYVAAVSAGSFQISVYTPSAQSPAAAPVLNFSVIKAVTA